MSIPNDPFGLSAGGDPAWSRYWLGLGGNLGDVEASICQALDLLDKRYDTRVEAVSGLYETPPWGDTDQPAFLNACACLSTLLDPSTLLRVVKEIEKELHRKPSRRWGPRAIDIDLLVHEGGPYLDERLEMPHPRMGERAFVLVPLADIAAELEVNGTSVADMLAGLDRSGIEMKRATGSWWPVSE